MQKKYEKYRDSLCEYVSGITPQDAEILIKQGRNIKKYKTPSRGKAFYIFKKGVSLVILPSESKKIDRALERLTLNHFIAYVTDNQTKSYKYYLCYAQPCFEDIMYSY